jgi:hypothetical protein
LYEQTVATQKSNSLTIPKRAWLGLWLLIFGVALAWRAQNLDAFGLSNDEGAHLMWARLAVDGYPLYSETQAVQAPLFIESVGWAFRLAGQTVQAGRWVTLVGFGLLAVTLSWLAQRAGGWPAALTALILTGISPLIFRFSRLVMGEVPATALAVVALALLVTYVQRGHRGWLVLSGLVLGLSLLVKALNLFVVVPVGLLLLIGSLRPAGSEHRISVPSMLARMSWRRLGTGLILWGVGVGLPLIVVLLLYEPRAIYDQLVVFRADLRATVPGTWSGTWQQFFAFSGSHWGFWILAIGGIISTVLRAYADNSLNLGKKNGPANPVNPGRQKGSTRTLFAGSGDRQVGQALSYLDYQFIWVGWLAAGVVGLAWHTPLFPHHFIVLLPPLILLGSGLVANLGALWPRQIKRGLSGYGPVGLFVVVMLGAMLNGPSMLRANQQTAAIVTGGREQEALKLLETVSNPNDFLMGDSQLLIFMADRRTPPPLGDVALVAIKAGRQTSANMIEMTDLYQSPAVVQWSLRLPWLPEYLAWLETNYLARRIWDDDHMIYYGRRFPSGQVMPNALDVQVGDSLAVRGYELDSSSISPGMDLGLKVYWETDAVLERDYTIFTQLLDSQGVLVSGTDSQPLSGYFPTSHWPVGEIVTDMIRVPLPAELPPGDYTLIIGMYLLETLERLPVSGGQADQVTLTSIKIQ